MGSLDDLLANPQQGIGWTNQPFPLLNVGNFPNGGYVHIGTDVPAVVTAWYVAHFSGTSPNNAWIGMYVDPNNYTWVVDGIRNDLALPFRGYGMVSAGVCRGYYNDYYDGAGKVHRVWGEVDAASHQYANSLFSLILDPTNINQDFTINGNSQGRGVIFEERLATVVNSLAVVAENVVYTTAPCTFPANRAVEITLSCQIKSAVVQNPIVRLRETNIGGTLLLSPPRTALSIAAQDFPVFMQDVFVNNGNTNLTRTLAVSLFPSAATAVTLNGAPAPSPQYIRVRDIGQASAFPNEVALT